MVQVTRRQRLVTTVIGGGLLTAAAAVTGPAGAQPADPPGNNGTVKVDGLAFDSHPNNEPHVGCTFEIDFYGYDEGDLEATVTFEAQPPTPSDDDEPLLEDTVFIGEDAAGGGTDLDAEVAYDLTDALAGIEPHPVQGWHVKLTIHAEGSQGADTKFKVFWVSGCDDDTPPPTVPGSTTTTEPDGSTTTVPGGPTTTSPEGPEGPEGPDAPPVTPPPAARPVVQAPDYAG
ncbi:MAG TPA: hypothetical protein VIL36_16215 [Acidimicrobiales bacterium]